MSNLSDVMTLPPQIPETIPNDWGWRNLTEICKPKQWKTISNSELTETGYRVFGANGFIGFYHEFNHEDETTWLLQRRDLRHCQFSSTSNIHHRQFNVFR